MATLALGATVVLTLAACTLGAPPAVPATSPSGGPDGAAAASVPPAAASMEPAVLAGLWDGELADPTGAYPVRVVLDGCRATGSVCGEIEYMDPARPEVVICASELTFSGTDGNRLAFSERLTYHAWMCLETTFTFRQSDNGDLEVEQYGEPDVVCCRGTLAYTGDAVQEPTVDLPTVAGLGRATSSTALGGATTQYAGAGAGSLWFPLEDIGKVARLDAASGAVTALVDTGDPGALPGLKSDPHGVAVGDAGVWVAQAAARSVGRIDPATNTIAEAISVPVVPYALALDGTSLWVTSFEDDRVVRVDLSTRQPVTEIAVDKPTGIAVGLGGVWIVRHRDDSVVRIDPAANEVVAEILLGERGPSDVCGMCVENVIVSDGSVWTANNEARSVSRIDPATNRVAATIELPLRAWAVTAGGGRVWASQFEALPDGGFANQSRWAVSRIDPATNEATSFRLAGALSVTWAGDELWVVTPGRRGDGVVRLELDPS